MTQKNSLTLSLVFTKSFLCRERTFFDFIHDIEHEFNGQNLEKQTVNNSVRFFYYYDNNIKESKLSELKDSFREELITKQKQLSKGLIVSKVILSK